MSLIRGTMASPDGRTVYATCDHHKVNVPVVPHHLALRDEMRAEIRRKGGREWLDDVDVGIGIVRQDPGEDITRQNIESAEATEKEPGRIMKARL